MNEFELINHYLKPLVKNNKASLNLQDDVALLTNIQKTDFIISTDTIVEDIHFFQNDPAKSIAHKILAVNLSDIASKGGTPKYFTLNFSPKSIKLLKKDWLDDFFNTIQKFQEQYKFQLIGGDTTVTKGPMIITSTIIAEVDYKKRKSLPFRFKAKNDDLIFVTGNIGDAYLGFHILAYNNNIIEKPIWLGILNNKDIEYLITKYHYPMPRVQIGKIIAENCNSCIDISDGLIGDLHKICEASKLFAKIKIEKDLFSKSALKVINNYPYILENMLSWGDDYELIFSVSPEKHGIIDNLKRQFTINLTFLGNFSSINEFNNQLLVNVLDANGNAIKYKYDDKSFVHY